MSSVKFLEQEMGKQFGNNDDPLLLSVRSGARASMPGMMDTILNLGMNDEAVEGLAKKSGNERFAWDSYRRFVQMYGDVAAVIRKAAAAVFADRGETIHFMIGTMIEPPPCGGDG